MPWSDTLPPREDADVVPWRQTARLAGTRRALPDSDDATALFAFRHWRDESGAVMDAARQGVAVPASQAPTLVLASRDDADVPFESSAALAASLAAALGGISATSASATGSGGGSSCSPGGRACTSSSSLW